VRFCANCGAPRDAASARFCRNCGTPFADAGSAPASSPPAAAPGIDAVPRWGGFWERFGAYVLDSVVVFVISIAATVVLSFVIAVVQVGAGESEDAAAIFVEEFILNGFLLISNLLSFGYFILFWSHHGHGQTLGMRPLNLRVVRTDGGELSLGRAFIRFIGFTLGSLVLFIGLIWAAFDSRKQGWHDKIADTYVVKTA
jgi:uncharacterized RDD family membrane protein YckC